jgi:hypothetical protein
MNGYIAAAIFFLFIAFMGFMIDLSGMHSHLMFRPYMTSDWIIWGIVTVSFLIGILFIVLGVRKRTHNTALPK